MQYETVADRLYKKIYIVFIVFFRSIIVIVVTGKH